MISGEMAGETAIEMAGEQVTFTNYGRPATAALAAAIAELKADDPLAPVTVITPSNYAGLSMRRILSGGSSGDPAGGRGLLNVRFMVLPRLAELLGGPLLAGAGKRPLTGLARQEAIRTALERQPGSFERVARHPATVEALDRSFRELDSLSEANVRQLATNRGRPGDVARLYITFRRLTEQQYSPAELSLAAAQATTEGSPGLRDVGAAVLLLPRPLLAPERALVTAFAAAGRLRVIAGLSGDVDVDRETHSWLAMLALDDGAPPAPPAPSATQAGAVEILSVADPEEETREVARAVGQMAEAGTSLARIGVLFRQREPYALLVHERLKAAGISHTAVAATSLRHTVPGRNLVKLLAIGTGGFRRTAVVDWLASAPILDRGRRRVPAIAWQRLSREAGITKGRDQWLMRLAAAGARYDAKADDAEREGQDHQAEQQRATGRETVALQEFMAELFDRLQPPEARSWRALAEWARGLQQRYLGTLGATANWPEDEVEAHQSVDEVINELASLDAPTGSTREPAGVAEFVSTLERALEQRRHRHGSFGAGVFAGSFSDATGMEFDHVFLLGMVEGQVPVTVGDDPLLQEASRSGVAGLPSRDARRNGERRDFLAATASAPSVTLLFPRTSTRSERPNLPSRWLLQIASGLAGHPIYTKEFSELEASSWFRNVPSFQAALHRGEQFGNEQELALADMLRAGARFAQAGAVGASAALANGLAMQQARASRHFTEFDGNVARRPARAPSATQPVSPTGLEQWAACPFRYLLNNILFVEETAEPDDTLRISPIERGTLIHSALEEFFTTASEADRRSSRWSVEEHARLEAIGQRLCEQAERSGLTGVAVLWRADRKRLLRELHNFLNEDDLVRNARHTVFERGELRFGRGSERFVVEVPGHSIAVRGSIDRVDRIRETDELVVYDYKSGSAGRYGEVLADVGTGAHLQLPIYALAAKSALGAGSVRAAYWFVNEIESYRRIEGSLDDQLIEQFGRTAGVIADGISAGVFPANPGKGYSGEGEQRGGSNCFFCPYDRLCPSTREEAWTRKRDDEPLAVYESLRGDH